MIFGFIIIRFEGEFLNGRRNGKGKEYEDYENKIIFEGEYLNGKRWNGNEYNIENGELEFTLKNGNGKVKEFNFDTGYTFIGEYKDGLRNGKGKEYETSGFIEFDGEYINGKKLKGKAYNNDFWTCSLYFEGEFLNRKKL